MSNSIYDVHINALQVMENELARLHNTLNRGDGDDDTTQAQISAIINELNRLSNSLSEAECTIEID